jgi:hypothetical protein
MAIGYILTYFTQMKENRSYEYLIFTVCQASFREDLKSIYINKPALLDLGIKNI